MFRRVASNPGLLGRLALLRPPPQNCTAGGTQACQLLSRQGFCTAPEPPKPKPEKKRGSFGSRLSGFIAGFTVCGTVSGYVLFYKVTLASDELAAAVRETASRQADIERRLAILEGR